MADKKEEYNNEDEDEDEGEEEEERSLQPEKRLIIKNVKGC